jgi:hypothetical protein
MGLERDDERHPDDRAVDDARDLLRSQVGLIARRMCVRTLTGPAAVMIVRVARTPVGSTEFRARIEAALAARLSPERTRRAPRVERMTVQRRSWDWVVRLHR